MKKLKWIVFRDDINSKEIKHYDVFMHNGFLNDVTKLLSSNLTKEDFAEKLQHSVQYYFWARSEMEIVISSWPVYINMPEFDRIQKDIEQSYKERGRKPYVVNVCPTVRSKVDIYEQINLNWDVFVDYVWSFKDTKRGMI